MKKNTSQVDKRAFVSHEGPKKVAEKVKIRTSMKCIKSIEAHEDWVEKVRILANGMLISSSQDGTLKLWDISKDNNKENVIFEGHEGPVTDIIEFNKGQIISVSKDKTIRKWNTSNGKEILCYKVDQPLNCIKKISEELIAIGGCDKMIKILDFSQDVKKEEGEEEESIEKYVLEGHNEEITCLELKNLNTLISSSMDKTIKIWDLNDKKNISTLTDHTMGVKCIKMLNDGRLASGSYDNTIKIWDLNKFICVQTLEGHKGHIFALSQLPDGRIISGATDWSMIVWNLQTGKQEFVLEGHEEAINSIDVLSDGKVVSGSIDQFIKVWD